ncbi:MAG TPA: glycosyltransferase family 39 protein, partial [Patescibacteria group bacterium]|nr:glycosyltransferase family 39 protein [Patescibacteria group bacterium]
MAVTATASPDSAPTALRRWWRRPAAPVVVISAAQLAIHLSTNGLYGLHTDELYYIVSGRHPALGYVDYPPVTPLLALLNTSIFGVSPWTLRLFPAITSAAVVFLAGMCARELDGGRWSSMFASFVALMSPLLLATWLFQTVEFDLLTWAISIYLMLRILRTGDRRLFLALGLALGIGLETKVTIVVLGVGVAAAILVSNDLRPMLRTRYPWIGLAIALAIAAPNVGWQIANGFPTLTYIHNHSADIAGSGGAVAFVELFILCIGPLLLPLWIAGLVMLFRDRRFRPMGVLVVVAILLFLPEGKAYYPAPTIPLVYAAGAVATCRLLSQTRRRWVVGLVTAGGILEIAVLGVIILPIVPASSMHRYGIDRTNPDFANTVGWQDMTEQVGAVYNALPSAQRSSAAILTSIDGQAGAIDIYGGSEHLPEAISPHLS